MHPDVKHAGDKVWVPGAERLAGNCRYISALASAAGALGSTTSYNELMGLSGTAFRFLFHHKWCPSSFEKRAGFYVQEGMKVLGYRGEAIPPNGQEARERITREIMSSVDSGYPVVACGWIGAESGLITGYADAGRTLFGRSFDFEIDPNAELDSDGYGHTEDMPRAAIHVIRGAGEPCNRRQAVIKSLHSAVDSANAGCLDEAKHYLSGFSAYETWIRDLREEDRIGAVVDRFDAIERGEGRSIALHTNWYCYLSLDYARREAGPYLSSLSREITGAAGAHLSSAGEIYSKLHQALTEGSTYAPRGLPKDQAWTEAMHQSQADALSTALELEKQGIAAIRTALHEITP